MLQKEVALGALRTVQGLARDVRDLQILTIVTPSLTPGERAAFDLIANRAIARVQVLMETLDDSLEKHRGR